MYGENTNEHENTIKSGYTCNEVKGQDGTKKTGQYQASKSAFGADRMVIMEKKRMRNNSSESSKYYQQSLRNKPIIETRNR